MRGREGRRGRLEWLHTTTTTTNQNYEFTRVCEEERAMQRGRESEAGAWVRIYTEHNPAIPRPPTDKRDGSGRGRGHFDARPAVFGFSCSLYAC